MSADKDKNGSAGSGKGDKEIVAGKANFEEAVIATGFGKFNILLLFFIIPSSFTQGSEQMALHYVLPVAECDLQLTLGQKGLLNSVTFAGMISSGLLAGVVCDTFGRKKMIVYGYLLHTLLSVLVACSTTVTQLMVMKFFCGFIFNGPFSAAATYLTEFHSAEYRARVQLIRGVTYSLGFFVLPIVAWGILPLDIHFYLFGTIPIHAWNIFMLCCATSPLIATIVFSFMPESPKFLMSVGRNEEALKVFQTVYSLNTGKPKSDFPIKELKSEVKEDNGEKKSFKEKVVIGWQRIAPIFCKPHIFRLMLACSVGFSVLTGLHIIKLWLPQILQQTNDYQKEHDSVDVCTIMNILKGKKNVSSDVVNCNLATDNSFVYINSMIINGSEILSFAISGFFVNWLGKKNLMRVLTSMASACAVGIFFAPSSAILTTLFTLYITGLDLSGVMAMTITLEMFPTHFRAISLSFHLMFSRIGSLIANIVFSYLVAAGCFVPFLFCCLLTGALPILISLYPDTENKNLQ